MKINSLKVHRLVNVPVDPPPLQDGPTRASMVLLEIATDDGMTGWSTVKEDHPSITGLLVHWAEHVVGLDPMRINRVRDVLTRTSQRQDRRIGQAYTHALSAVDIALWDIKGKALGQPIAHLLGGMYDTMEVYLSIGVSAGHASDYGIDDLVAEAKWLVSAGHGRFKTRISRDPTPNIANDYKRILALREAVGPDIKIAMDSEARLSLPEAVKLCRAVEELDIDFYEEPVYDNDPQLLAELRSKTTVPIAASETSRYSTRDLLGSVDIMAPNVISDGGFTGAFSASQIALAYNKPLFHGNGAGPENLHLYAGVGGDVIEYIFTQWMAYRAIFDGVPEPQGQTLRVSDDPGTGLTPRADILEDHGVLL